MKVDRAKEIIESLGYIDVEYKNNPVYINRIIEEDSSAMVKDLNTNEIKKVPIEDLTDTY